MSLVPPWGCPWHGRVQGGQLHLPNSTTLAWPQPDGTSAGSVPDHAGYTFFQKLPGVAEVERTPEESVADMAAGMEWRNSFIVSGTDASSSASALVWPQIHSKPAGGWIYAAPGGGRWLIKGGGRYGFSQGGPLNLNIRLVRFGELAGAPSTISLTVSATAAEIQQITPDIGVSSFSAKVEDISPSGDRAIVMLYFGNKVPVGFALLTLTGTPGVDFIASLSVLKSRAQTLGAMTQSSGVVSERLFVFHTFSRAENDQTGPAPACGFKEVTDTPAAQARLPIFPESANATVASGENRTTVTGRVLAMWFDAEGVPQPLTLNSTQSYSISAPSPSNSVAGRVVRRTEYISSGNSCAEGASSFTEYMSYAMSQTVSEVAVQTASLSYLGQSESVEYRHERTVTQSASYTGVSSAYQGIPPVSSSASQTGGRTISIDGVTVMTVSEDSSSSFASPGPFVGPPPEMLVPIYNIPQLRNVVISLSDPVSWRRGVKRWSNSLIGWRALSAPVPLSYPALSPKGLQSPDNANASGEYGSLNPLTGEAVFPSVTPVSWT
jgi:hypothetical protein